MTLHTFRVPKDQTLQNILKFSNELAVYSEPADEFLFDFQKTGYNTPFGMFTSASRSAGLGRPIPMPNAEQ